MTNEKEALPEPTKERFDKAWDVIIKHCQWERKRDYEHHEFEFSVRHVRRCADHNFGIKLTWNQAVTIVNEAEGQGKLSSPFNWAEAEEAIKIFCAWADLDEANETYRRIMDA